MRGEADELGRLVSPRSYLFSLQKPFADPTAVRERRSIQGGETTRTGSVEARRAPIFQEDLDLSIHIRRRHNLHRLFSDEELCHAMHDGGQIVRPPPYGKARCCKITFYRCLEVADFDRGGQLSSACTISCRWDRNPNHDATTSLSAVRLLLNPSFARVQSI